MEYRTLGTTGVRVSTHCLGTMMFGGGGNADHGDCAGIIHRALDAGINFVDTADVYSDGESEEIVGEALEGRRDEVVLATKVHWEMGPGQNDHGNSRLWIMHEVENSLRRLRTDHIDLYQYHSWGDEQFFDPSVQAELEKMRKEGKVLHLGNSVGSTNNLKQVRSSTMKNIEAIQIVYNRLDRAPESNGVFDVCTKQDLGVLARVPLASGLLSGKYQPGHVFPEGDVRAGRDRAQTDAKLREVEQIARTEVPPAVEMAQWALAWCLQHPAVTCVIPGCKSVEQVKTNAAAAELPIVRDDHPQAIKPI